MLTGIISSKVRKTDTEKKLWRSFVNWLLFYSSSCGILGLWISCGVRDVSYLQLHHHLRLLWPGTDTSGSGRLHLLEPKTNSHCMSNTRTTLKPPYLCPLQQIVLIEKSSWNRHIQWVHMDLRTSCWSGLCPAVCAKHLSTAASNIWRSTHASDTEVGPYFCFTMTRNLNHNQHTFNTLQTLQTTKCVRISALLSKRRNTPHNITWLHESYLI